MTNTNQIRLINIELNRPFFVSSPEFISRKMVMEIKPILDELATISRNRALEKYFLENPGILEYISSQGVINIKKVKEMAVEMGLDPKDKNALAEAESQVRNEMISAYPGVLTNMRNYDLEIDIHDQRAWNLSIELIRQVGVVKQQVDKDLLEKNDDPNNEFWSEQSVEEIGKFAQFFRRFVQ